MSTLFVFEVVLVMISGVFGITGNILLIRLFMNSEVKLNFHKLMITTAIYDTIYIALSILVFSVPELFEDYRKNGLHAYVVPAAIPILQVALTGSVYCTVAISIERYLTVCHPFYIASKRWSLKRYIIPIILFSVLYNVSRFFEMTTECIEFETEISDNTTIYTHGNSIPFTQTHDKSNLSINDSSENFNVTALSNGNESDHQEKFHCKIKLTDIRQNSYYYSIYIIGLNFVFNGFIPFALIIVLNTLLYKQLKLIVSGAPFISYSLPASTLQIQLQIQQRNLNIGENVGNGIQSNNKQKRIRANEMILARVSILIVIVFIVCHSVRWIPNIYELIQRINLPKDEDINWPFWIETITQISHFLTVFNSSVNFYIYWATHYGMPFTICSKNRSGEIEMSQIGGVHATNCEIISDMCQTARGTSV